MKRKNVEESDQSIVKPEQRYARKQYLAKIEQNFSIPNLEAKPLANFSFYPYANDIQKLYFDGYISKFNTLVKQRFFSRPDTLNKAIGLIVGNGYILSLLPDLAVDDIILIDIEPAVHHFILFVKDLILNTEAKDFSQKRAEIVTKINHYCEKIKSFKLLSEEDTLASEIKALGDKHFLASEDRFNQCKKTLQEKDLLPIKLNILDYKAVKKLAELLKEQEATISFINITNMGDYDRFRALPDILACLPLANEFVIISTSLISTANREELFPRSCLISNNLEQLEENLSYNYKRNSR
ncbi:hypothetical protein ACQUW5_14440 [Legionella sp. CNM-1927-20]|uniref:hypothetical protein n=1 Tax=Legionella sp. CNM-1927-20 TaxID=3422221 RepID=UPI00403AC5A8